MLTNKTNLEIIDSFNNTEYCERLIALFPKLKGVDINVVNYKESKYAIESDFQCCDAFVYYVPNPRSIELPIYAEILINEEAIKGFGLTENEIFAALVHEIGHITITVELQGKSPLPVEFEEITCDNNVCQMGLAESMCSLLRKLLDFGEYLPIQKTLMSIRITNINDYILCQS